MNSDRRRGVPPRVQGSADEGNAAGRRVCDEFGYFRPEESVAKLAGNLPHWRQEAVTYFVTFRLADSLPQAKLDEWSRQRDAWLATHPQPWTAATRNAYHKQFTAKIEKWPVLAEGVVRPHCPQS